MNLLTIVIAALVCLALTTGCGIPVKEGRLYPVVGLGFVKVSTNSPSARVVNSSRTPTVERVDSAGVLAGVAVPVRGVSLGVLKRQSVVIPPDAEILMETATDTAGNLDVTVIFPNQQNHSEREEP